MFVVYFPTLHQYQKTKGLYSRKTENLQEAAIFKRRCDATNSVKSYNNKPWRPEECLPYEIVEVHLQIPED